MILFISYVALLLARSMVVCLGINVKLNTFLNTTSLNYIGAKKQARSVSLGMTQSRHCSGIASTVTSSQDSHVSQLRQQAVACYWAIHCKSSASQKHSPKTYDAS